MFRLFGHRFHHGICKCQGTVQSVRHWLADGSFEVLLSEPWFTCFGGTNEINVNWCSNTQESLGSESHAWKTLLESIGKFCWHSHRSHGWCWNWVRDVEYVTLSLRLSKEGTVGPRLPKSLRLSETWSQPNLNCNGQKLSWRVCALDLFVRPFSQMFPYLQTNMEALEEWEVHAQRPGVPAFAALEDSRARQGGVATDPCC